jgi:signal transduction histidine kinase
VLRREDDEAALEPLPSLTHLADLVARARAAGLPVELRVEGDAPELPAGIDLTAYRVVQEALGEALEAGGDRRASVHLRYGERELLLDVTDAGATARREGRGPARRPERVALYGGELLAEQLGAGGHAVRAGLPVTLHVQGAHHPLPHGAELAAYRVVQEALTNALKHAAGAPTDVIVEWSERALEVRVADRGGTASAHRLEGGGHGLVGMAERVRLYGGELRTGPRDGGGFEVVARIPAESARAAVAT